MFITSFGEQNITYKCCSNFLIHLFPSDLKEYAHHIRLDGNEAAHEGSTEKQDAEDLLDFTELFLERIYTMKKQLELAQERRLARRTK